MNLDYFHSHLHKSFVKPQNCRKKWMNDHYKSIWATSLSFQTTTKSHFPFANSISINSPIHQRLLLFVDSFFTLKKLKDYCQCKISKLHFQFPTHVLQGKKKRNIRKGKKCKWLRCYQLCITLVTLKYFISLVAHFRWGKKPHYMAIQVNSFIILLNISLLFRFLLYLPKTKQGYVFLHM